MKVTFILTCCLVFSATASTYSQNTRLTLNLQNATILDLMQDIESHSKFIFLYQINDLNLNKKVNAEFKDAKIEEILDAVLKGEGLSYEVFEKQILISKEERGFDPSLLPTQQPQKKEISGSVKDSKGLPLPGVTVMIKGTTNGTVTSGDGKFKLSVLTDAKTLVFSFIGMKTQEIPVTGKTTLNVTLAEEAYNLDEVVAVGYGTLKRSDLTGSVSKMVAKNIEEKSYSSVEQMLQGNVSGVQITQNTGALGGGITFSIRGAASLTGSSAPLIVIDGYPVESGEQMTNLGANGDFDGSSTTGLNALSSLNPNDIESIDILKDASSTAIYGSRGANGVVMITTKRGKAGRDKVEYSYRMDASQLGKKIDVLRPDEYMAFMNEAALDTRNGSIRYNYAAMQANRNIQTYWQDVLYQTGISQNHLFNISGGDDKLRYALIAGYNNQEGVIKNTSFERGTFRLNVDRQVNYRFKFGVNINGMLGTNNALMQSGSRGQMSSVVLSALRTNPLYVYEGVEDENLSTLPQSNPLSMVQKVKDKTATSQLSVSAFGEYKLWKDLLFRVRLGFNNQASSRDNYMPRQTYLGDSRMGYAYVGDTKATNFLSEYTLNYNATLAKKHKIDAVGGFTWQNWESSAKGISTANYPGDYLSYYAINAAGTVDKPKNSFSKYALASFLGRVNYTFDRRFLLTLTSRYDGSTRLAEGHKWAMFPSAAVGWNIHNESFLKSFKVLSEMKLRLSYGESGNQSIGVGSTKSMFNVTNQTTINRTIVPAFVPQNMSNKNLTWETTQQYNIGLDLGFDSFRYKLGAELYYKKTKDLLINLPIPITSGFGAYASNTGSLENKGLELDGSAVILSGKLKWTSSGNISFNRNKILKFDNSLQQILGPTFGAISPGGSTVHISKVGYPIGSFYGYKFAGIYQTQDEIDHYAKETAGDVRPGDVKYEDVYKDGVINTDDMTIIGNPYPKYFFGFNNDFSWNNFSLSFLIQGVIGQDVVNAPRSYMDGMSINQQSNIRREAYDNRWTGPGTSNTYPAARSAIAPFFGRFSNFIVEDGSFVRLKNVNFSYALPSPLLTKIRLHSLKFFVSCSNLITLTKYKGFDPEVNSSGFNSQTPGVDNGTIPQYKTYSMGLSLGF